MELDYQWLVFCLSIPATVALIIYLANPVKDNEAED